ncbi:MAG: chemotaxis protein CheC [Lachnospiraceae bacterium]|nr:chemotaxis protein CheC [Lachnospiraceae bacterium]
MSKIDFNQDNEEYFDVLREIGNVGASNASAALAQLLGRRVEVHVPKVKLLDFQEIGKAIGGEEQIMTGIYLRVEGQINGSMLLLLKKQAAARVAGILLGDPDRDPKAELTEIECSALSEVGNIVTSAYLNAISTLTGLKTLPSVPSLCVDMAGAILSVPAIEFGMMCDKLLLIENRFSGTTDGYLVLVPDIDSYDRMLEALGM